MAKCLIEYIKHRGKSRNNKRYKVDRKKNTFFLTNKKKMYGMKLLLASFSK